MIKVKESLKNVNCTVEKANKVLGFHLSSYLENEYNFDNDDNITIVFRDEYITILDEEDGEIHIELEEIPKGVVEYE